MSHFDVTTVAHVAMSLQVHTMRELLDKGVLTKDEVAAICNRAIVDSSNKPDHAEQVKLVRELLGL